MGATSGLTVPLTGLQPLAVAQALLRVASMTDPVLRAVATIIAGIGLHGVKVQQGVAADEALQFCGAEQVDGRTPAQHHEPSGKRLKLQQTTKLTCMWCRTQVASGTLTTSLHTVNQCYRSLMSRGPVLDSNDIPEFVNTCNAARLKLCMLLSLLNEVHMTSSRERRVVQRHYCTVLLLSCTAAASDWWGEGGRHCCSASCSALIIVQYLAVAMHSSSKQHGEQAGLYLLVDGVVEVVVHIQVHKLTPVVLCHHDLLTVVLERHCQGLTNAWHPSSEVLAEHILNCARACSSTNTVLSVLPH